MQIKFNLLLSNVFLQVEIMPTALEQKRIRDLITETVTVLCQTSLNFRSKFTVQGLLGITIDDKDVFLINIDEVISSLKGKRRKVSGNKVDDKKSTGSTLSGSYVAVECMQSPELHTHCSEPCSTCAPENMLPCDQFDEDVVHSLKHETDQSVMSLPADIEPLETDLSLSLGSGVNDLSSTGSRDVYELQDHVYTVKKESISENSALDSQFDCVNRDLLTECNLNLSNKEDADIQV